ncbi:D-glycero-alpha-D-manno-heptose-1,7-bisphosphate 7-phosphatase [Chloroflexota bacterium]
MKIKAVFLDRDDTVNQDVPYCARPEQFVLLPFAAEGIRKLKEHGFKVIIITNQSGIARGFFDEEMLAKIHTKMGCDLAKQGAFIDDIYYCPHHLNDNCDCRKPKPKLLLMAVDKHKIDLNRSFVVGNSNSDIELGHAVGCRTIRIVENCTETEPNMIVPTCTKKNLLEAALWIVAQNDSWPFPRPVPRK